MLQEFDLWMHFLLFISLYFGVVFTILIIRNFRGMKQLPNTKWQPAISVIIPAYNEEEYIEKCIESLVNTDYPKNKLEVIVINDGSTDNTAKIARKYQNKYIRVLSKPNTGKADSLNFGIRHAKGEIIATLDADSYVAPYSINRMLPLFKEKNVAAVASSVKVRNAKNLIEEIQRIEYLYAIFSRKVVNYIDSVQVTPGPFSMFYSWVFKKIGGFDTKSLVEDQEIALRLQSHQYQIRSSIDADVYTEIPKDLKSLMHQRVRWQRGGFWNSVKYLNLINPKYGDLGLLILPFGIFGYVSIVSSALIGLFLFINKSFYERYLGIEALFLSIGATQILTVIAILFALIWFFYWLTRLFQGEKLSKRSLIMYLIFYPIMIAVFWVIAFIKEVQDRRSNKTSW